MSLLSKLRSGVYLYDRRTGHERLVQAVERYGQVVFLHIVPLRTRCSTCNTVSTRALLSSLQFGKPIL
jgi:hypothetical protein